MEDPSVYGELLGPESHFGGTGLNSWHVGRSLPRHILTIPYYTIPYFAILDHTTLYHTMLYHTILYLYGIEKRLMDAIAKAFPDSHDLGNVASQR